MNRALDLHGPTPEFRARLEWQVETALRRETRFAAPVTGRWPRLGGALVVITALALGGLAGMATGFAQEARERDRLLEAARADAHLLALRLELARADYQEARKRFDVGAADRETLLAAERRMRGMETMLARSRVDMDEIRQTSAAPRNELDAPLVGARDFVRERLILELEQAQRVLAAAEQAAARAKERVSIGIAPTAAGRNAEAELAQARADMELLGARLEMRQRFLRGEIKRDDLTAAVRRLELTLQLRRLEGAIAAARGRVEEVGRLVDTGAASQLELKRAEIDLLEGEVELKRLRQEYERLPAPPR